MVIQEDERYPCVWPSSALEAYGFSFPFNVDDVERMRESIIMSVRNSETLESEWRCPMSGGFWPSRRLTWMWMRKAPPASLSPFSKHNTITKPYHHSNGHRISSPLTTVVVLDHGPYSAFSLHECPTLCLPAQHCGRLYSASRMRALAVLEGPQM